MNIEVIKGIMLPFLGTSLGAACVFFMRKSINALVQKALNGFAAGVMMAASVWSLLLPAIEQSGTMGKWSFFPAATGFFSGVLCLLCLDRVVTKLMDANDREKKRAKSSLKQTAMLVLAVTLHNIPEGMAVGAQYAGWISGNVQITLLGAMVLSLGIAIQNFPEGAIISLPLRAEGLRKEKAFVCGVLSGAVEPISAWITILAADLIGPALPYLLSFAAGAMVYVVVAELVPEFSEGDRAEVGILSFAIGFTIMMILDVALG